MKLKYTREDLISICEQSFVSQNEWHNRNSSTAVQQVGNCLALLKAGCEFKILSSKKSNLNTDNHIIWVEIEFRGFNWYECTYHDKDQDDYLEEEIFYLPIQARLNKANGKDWY